MTADGESTEKASPEIEQFRQASSRRRLAEERRAKRKDQQLLEEARDTGWVRIRLGRYGLILILLIGLLVCTFTGGSSDHFFSIKLLAAAKSLLFAPFSFGGPVPYLLLAMIGLLVWLRRALPKRLMRVAESPNAGRARAVNIYTLAFMLLVGLVGPLLVSYSAYRDMPAMRFDQCIGQLRKDATVALVDGDDGARYATVASAKHGNSKYALVRAGDGWIVTDMFADKTIDRIPGC